MQMRLQEAEDAGGAQEAPWRRCKMVRLRERESESEIKGVLGFFFSKLF